MTDRTTLDVDGKRIDVTNLRKIFYPKTGFTKGNVIDYYIRISPMLLPHLRDRPISLKRYPDGVEGFFFYEKRCPKHRPKWMKTVKVDKKEGGNINYCMMNGLPALIWAANLADLELHTFLHRAPALHRPTAIAFDLDPGAPANIVQCCQVAMLIRDIFSAFRMECFAKTSGSKGVQVYVPLNTAVTYQRTKAFAKAIADLLAEQEPKLITAQMKKSLRKGKVFVDWSQNDDTKTTVTVYSLRAKGHPTVSTPVTWKEIESAVKRKKTMSFTSDEVLKRVKKTGDLFEPVLTLKQKLPTLQKLKAFIKN